MKKNKDWRSAASIFENHFMLSALNQKLSGLSHEKKKLVSIGVQTGIMRILSALFAFILTIAVARFSDATVAGQFFYLFNVVSFVAIVSQLGFNVSLVKYNAIAFSQNSIQQQSENYTISVQRSLAFSFSLCILAFIVQFAFGASLINVNITPSLFALFSLTIPLIVLAQLNSYALQAIRHVTPAIFALQMGVSCFLVLFITILHFFELITLISMLLALLLSASLVALISTIQWLRSGQYSTVPLPVAHNAELTDSAKQVWIGNIFTNVIQWGSLIIAGFYLTDSDLGLLAAAQRTSLLIGFVLISVNFIVAPMFASLYQQGEMKKLKKLSTNAFRLNISLSLIPVIACTFYSQEVMTLFGAEFESAGILLAILALGQLVNVATGSVGFLLLMSGYEKTMKYITIASGSIAIILLLALSQMYGVIGAASSIAIGMAIQNLAALYYVKRYLGFVPIG
ncbi:oligosaccharide flippase family protein [Vibrio vulnificus]|nr:oligosaccharide flippase family protein [Vibrio vulnificus]